MGRLRKYFTEEEKREAQRRWNKQYYRRNKEKLDSYAKKNYKNKKRL